MAEGNEIIKVKIDTATDIVVARQRGRELAAQLEFSASEQIFIATAISEIARNIVEYANHGEITLEGIQKDGKRGIEVIAHDAGRGIADVEQAMRDHYTTGKGLGMGLPGSKRLMDEFEVISKLGEGTTVIMRKWR